MGVGRSRSPETNASCVPHSRTIRGKSGTPGRSGIRTNDHPTDVMIFYVRFDGQTTTKRVTDRHGRRPQSRSVVWNDVWSAPGSNRASTTATDSRSRRSVAGKETGAEGFRSHPGPSSGSTWSDDGPSVRIGRGSDTDSTIWNNISVLCIDLRVYLTVRPVRDANDVTNVPM